MGREHRTESRTDSTARTVQPTFYLVGAPGTRKSTIAQELASRFDNELAVKIDSMEGSKYALGSVADYRVELKLAMDRAFQGPLEMPVLYTHSLIDNLAYISYALSRYESLPGSVSTGTAERTVLTLALIGTIMTDSFRYDHIFFLRGDFDPEEDYDQSQIQALLQIILDEYQINYSVIDANEDSVDKISMVIEQYLKGNLID